MAYDPRLNETKRDQMVDDSDSDEIPLDIDPSLSDKKLRNGLYYYTCLSCKYGPELFLSENYQANIIAIFIDEAHCILEAHCKNS